VLFGAGILVRCAAGIPVLSGARIPLLCSAGNPVVFGEGIHKLCAAEVSVVYGVGIPVLCGAGIPVLRCAGIPVLYNADIPVLCGTGIKVFCDANIPVLREQVSQSRVVHLSHYCVVLASQSTAACTKILKYIYSYPMLCGRGIRCCAVQVVVHQSCVVQDAQCCDA
jgi:hypothetical protein